MDVRQLGQLIPLYLCHRTGHHDRGVRKRLRQAGNERIVEPLIDDPKVAEHRTRQLRHCGGHLRWRKLGTAEVRHVHAATIKLHVVVVTALGFEQLVSAGEHYVGVRQQKLLARGDISGSETEVGQFVHTVVDDTLATKLPQQAGRCHGRIEPLHRIFELAPQQRVTQQRDPHQRQYRCALILDIGTRGRKNRYDPDDVRLWLGNLQPWSDSVAGTGRKRLLDVRNPVACGKSGEDLLRALPDKIPAQMTVDEDGEMLDPA